MPVVNTVNRRRLLSTGASLVTTGASFMLLPNVYAQLVQGDITRTMRCKNAFNSAETAMRCAHKQSRIA